MGERKRRQKQDLAGGVGPRGSDTALVEQRTERLTVDTLGGRIQVDWDPSAQATPHGQLVFFAAFLAAAGVFDAWVHSCPVAYTSSNAPSKRDVLGTILLGVLAGNTRYAHITGIRGDAVAANLLGIDQVMSADSIRRALMQLTSEVSSQWLRPHLLRSVQPVLNVPWILDIDATVKPLYGHQQGATKSYNPKKPGRPSHVLHTYWVGNVRQVLDVQLQAGNEHTSSHMRTGLGQILDELTPETRPALVRGDGGYGNEPVIIECENRQQPYLFRLRQTANVKRLIDRVMRRSHWTAATEMTRGFESIEDELLLSGWTQRRRVIVLRRRIRSDLAITTQKADGSMQTVLALPTADVEFYDNANLWEFTVLATNTTHELASLGQLYRDRCDCENGFDELKNQWGWGGFTTQDIARNQTMARCIALIYNWWSWYARAANPTARLEAVTSRPLLLAAVGRLVHHAGQSLLYLTPIHASVDLIRSMNRNVSNILQHVKHDAQQCLSLDRWAAILRNIVEKMQLAATPAIRSIGS
jgi:hypothetical protein